MKIQTPTEPSICLQDHCRCSFLFGTAEYFRKLIIIEKIPNLLRFPGFSIVAEGRFELDTTGMNRML